MLRYLVMLAIAASATAEDVDWSQTAEEAARTLQEYIRFDTTVPPGDVRASADFLEGILETEGISVTRYSSAPGKVNRNCLPLWVDQGDGGVVGSTKD